MPACDAVCLPAGASLSLWGQGGFLSSWPVFSWPDLQGTQKADDPSDVFGPATSRLDLPPGVSPSVPLVALHRHSQESWTAHVVPGHSDPIVQLVLILVYVLPKRAQF